MTITDYDNTFDKYLLEHALPASFLAEHQDTIDHWLNPDSYEKYNKRSVDLHRALVEFFLSGKLNEGSMQKIYENMVNYEEQIQHVTVKLGEKFYRDHISHVLKVTLLMLSLAKDYFGVTDNEELNTLAIVGHILLP
jgi:hypothetical protein